MARSWPTQSQFTAGEVSPKLYGRTDLKQYFQGCRTLTNWQVMPHGGVTRRAGTRFVGEVKDSAHPPRLIPFIFGVEQAYVIELGHDGGAGYMRYYKDQGRVVEGAKTITAATQATPVVIAAAGHGYPNGAQVMIAGVAGMTEINGRRFTVTGQTANTFELSGEDGTGHTAYVSGGEAFRVYEIATPPWAEADLWEVMFAQSNDIMYMAHPSQPPQQLTRTGHTAWTLSTYTVTLGKNPVPAFTAANDYPGAVTFIQQRLAWAASNNNPQKIWLSRSGDFLDLLAGTNAADPFDATVASPRTNVGRWLLGSKGLFFGTAGAVWRVNADEITPTNFPLKRVASAGCAYRAPVDVDDTVVFSKRYGKPANDGRQLDSLGFNVDTDEYSPDEISVISEHLLAGGVREMAWQEQPDRTLWIATEDGALLSCTYYPQQAVIGWARHIIAGAGAAVESVAVIPGDNGDEVWLVVRRTINGATRRYIEVIDPTPSPDNVYVDAAVAAATSSATALWTGLNHLEGESVAIRADGAPVASKIVSGGAILLDAAALTVEIGLTYSATLVTNDLATGAPDGASQGRKKAIGKLILQLKDSGGLTASAKTGTAGDDVVFREVGDEVGAAIPLFTGPIAIKPPSGWDRLGRVTITANQPLPATVLALIMREEVND
ncbi:MAG: hypothetical protein O2967_17745 [Proteobacteria bacterium]|nr:hypothetical protein [Pseudomonadota bacterium]